MTYTIKTATGKKGTIYYLCIDNNVAFVFMELQELQEFASKITADEAFALAQDL
jgi:hypothetical protein